ncbi:hypothetical protein F5B22DRAFT_653895 [Xylaria bambusicola]|uniref:uncharacterized protein n=1 Tax=Xylaria bambusicola TaxID=326684 RepID=UPI0020083523|nr:uncharacterized protein F5B22DRAFT_653895 [Xylaria bambusicola]KAI0518381.1 hypothetical protein F5B22DRAFT_653895 [Xylaria bambusicola]
MMESAENQQLIPEGESTIPRKSLNSEAALLRAPLHTAHYIAPTRNTGWVWEYFALALSASAVTALIVLLAYMNDLPLSHWKAIVSPTTTVSILAATIRVSLSFAISSCLGQAKWTWFKKQPDKLLAFKRFDDASRGPWGSFWLIIWVKALYHIAAIGAAVTILLLAFEPSFQAIITFDCRIDSSDAELEALLGRSEFLDTGTYYAYEGISGAIAISPNTTVTIVPYVSQPDLGLVSGINSGFYNLSSAKRQTASFACPTANCTWTAFTTLAVCSACNDVTSSIKRHREEANDIGTLKHHDMQIYTNWTINALPRLNLTNMSTAEDDTGQLTPAYMSATRLVNHQHTITFQNLSTMMTAVQIIKASDEYIHGNIPWDDSPVTAIECALYFCVNAYKSHVVQGELEEEPIASWSERDPNSFAVTDTSLASPEVLEEWDRWNNYSLYSDYGDAQRSDLKLFIPHNDPLPFGLPENVTTVFTLTQRAIGSTLHFINEDFFSETMVWPLQGDGLGRGAPPVVQALYQSTNISETFQKASQSITNWIRDTSNATHVGTTQEWTIRIHIEWPYIAAPLAAFIAGLVFCAFSIAETHKLGLDAWKTNMIAALTHSVDAETRAQLRYAYRHGFLDKAVNAMSVRLEDAGHGLELKIKQT